MTAFDRDDLTANDRFRNELPPNRGLPTSVRSTALAWMAGLVVLTAIAGIFSYETGAWGTRPSAPTAGVTQPLPPPGTPTSSPAKP
jgi:hypothetical protein